MHTGWEVWGIVGVIAFQSVFIWQVYRLASQVCMIYLLQFP